MNEDINELKLLEGLRSGDEGAFRTFFMMNYTRIVMFVSRFIEDRQDRQSVVNDTFLSFWEQTLGKIRFLSMSKAVGYLYRSALHQSLNYLRSQKRKLETVELRDQEVNELPDSELVVWETEMTLRIYAAIKTLPDTSREVLEAIYVRDKSILQIARELGIGYDAAQKRKIRAEQLLIHKIQKWTKLVILVKVVLLTLFYLWKELSHSM